MMRAAVAMGLVMVLAGFVFCMLQIGAGFLLALLSPEIVATGPALRVLAWVLFLRAITTLVGPVLVVVGAHSQILWIAVLAVVVTADLPAVAQLRPGDVVRLRPAR